MTNRSSLSGLLTSICHCLRTPRLCGEKNVRRKEQYGMKAKAAVAQLGMAFTLLSSARATENWLRRIETEWIKVEAEIVAMRHQIHQNPELSTREAKTPRLMPDHLGTRGWAVSTGV